MKRASERRSSGERPTLASFSRSPSSTPGVEQLDADVEQPLLGDLALGLAGLDALALVVLLAARERGRAPPGAARLRQEACAAAVPQAGAAGTVVPAAGGSSVSWRPEGNRHGAPTPCSRPRSAMATRVCGRGGLGWTVCPTPQRSASRDLRQGRTGSDERRPRRSGGDAGPRRRSRTRVRHARFLLSSRPYGCPCTGGTRPRASHGSPDPFPSWRPRGSAARPRRRRGRRPRRGGGGFAPSLVRGAWPSGAVEVVRPPCGREPPRDEPVARSFSLGRPSRSRRVRAARAPTSRASRPCRRPSRRCPPDPSPAPSPPSPPSPVPLPPAPPPDACSSARFAAAACCSFSSIASKAASDLSSWRSRPSRRSSGVCAPPAAVLGGGGLAFSDWSGVPAAVAAQPRMSIPAAAIQRRATRPPVIAALLRMALTNHRANSKVGAYASSRRRSLRPVRNFLTSLCLVRHGCDPPGSCRHATVIAPGQAVSCSRRRAGIRGPA